MVARLMTLGDLMWLSEPSILSCQTQGAIVAEKKQ